jgi:hypothetical protein
MLMKMVPKSIDLRELNSHGFSVQLQIYWKVLIVNETLLEGLNIFNF